MKVYAIFALKEEHDPTPYSSICDVEVELYGISRAEGVAQMVREVRAKGFQSRVIRLPFGSLLGEDAVSCAFIEETLLCETYGHWE